MISAEKQMRGSLTSNDSAFFNISDTMTTNTSLSNNGNNGGIIPPVTNNRRHQWKNSLQVHEKKEYDAYLQKLRETCPDNSWRLKTNNKYHPLCKNGFIQRHCNLEPFLNETCVQTNTN